MSTQSWKELLSKQIPEDHADLINNYETTMLLKREGKVEEKVFNEFRLRHGVYGQRYDNGQRHDGQASRKIPFPCGDTTKGVGTIWDAPGMQRIKIPYGGMTTEQMLVLADVAEEYSDEILHVTTRQDFQFHYIHIEDTPDLFRRLAAVGITTQEACGNGIRNITACPYIGVCSDEPFDVNAYAEATFRFLLGHPDCQDFGRKFKISFSGCEQHACGLAQLHDLGFVAQTRSQNGKTEHGFRVAIGGGLGAVPMQAKTYTDFLPANQILSFCQAVARVFAKHGEKKNRNKARLKFLVNDWGFEKFKQEVETERAALKEDPKWQSLIDKALKIPSETPLKTKSSASKNSNPEYNAWFANNVRAQRQKGFVTVTISLPLGDITSKQMRALARLCPKYINDTIRTSVEQNLVMRWVNQNDLPKLYDDLKKLNLANADYNTVESMMACPGTDTCKLGISSSRGLASELKRQIKNGQISIPKEVQNLNVRMSGCFNSCGQHHIADIGFYGVSRKVGDYMVPFFQLVLGGERAGNAQSYGLATMAIPSKNVPKALEKLTQHFNSEKNNNENFQDFIKRLGKGKIKILLGDLMNVPAYESAPEFYTDWGDIRTYSKKDIGIGECAGEVVSPVDFAMQEADREIFEAQVALDANDLKKAQELSFGAMLKAASGFAKEYVPQLDSNFENVKKVFDEKLVQSKVFLDPFAGDRFAKFFLNADRLTNLQPKKEDLHHYIEEAQLFIEACHSYQARREL